MPSFPSKFVYTRLHLASLLAIALCFGFAKPGFTQSLGSRAAAKARGVAISKDIDDTLAQIKTGKVDAVSTSLFRSNLSAANTLEGTVESANKLLTVAFALRGRYDYRHEAIITQQALDLLEGKAPQFALVAKAPRRAAVDELRGIIYEQLRFDFAAARKAYEQALTANPDSKTAQIGLARVQDHEDQVNRIQFGPGKGSQTTPVTPAKS